MLWRGLASSKRRIPLVEDARRIPDRCLLVVADDWFESIAHLRRRRDLLHMLRRVRSVRRHIVTAAVVRQWWAGWHALASHGVEGMAVLCRWCHCLR